MNNKKELNIEKDLIGMQVLLPGESRKWAEVTDAIIHPTDGKLLGLALRAPGGRELLLAAPYFTIEANAIRVKVNPFGEVKGLRRELPEGVYAQREMMGSSVVSNDGQLLGSIMDVYVSAELTEATYRVSESRTERFLGGSLLMAGNLSQSYSREGGRMIVSAEAVKGRQSLLDHYRAALHAMRSIIHRRAVLLWLFMATTLLGIVFWL